MRKIIGILLCVLLVGCSPVRLPDVSYYQLTSTRIFQVPAKTKTQNVLYVILPSANPGYQTSDMLYMATPYKLSTFTLHQWVAPPSQMLQTIVMQAVRATGYFKAVLTVPASAEATYRLELQLLELRQEFLTPISVVRMAVQATLVSNAEGRVVASRRFQAVIPASGKDPYSGVLAANRAVTDIATEVARFCVRSAN